MLSLWLDIGIIWTIEYLGQKIANVNDNNSQAKIEKFNELHRLIKKLSERLPAWQFVTAMPQLISRICHKNPKVHQVIEAIIQGVLALYPEQMLWHLVSVSKSTLKIRSDRINQIFSKMKVLSYHMVNFKSNTAFNQLDSSYLDGLILEAQKLSHLLINLCNHHISGRDVSLNMPREFRALYRLTPLRMIVPLQSSMTVQLPAGTTPDTNLFATHKPFPKNLPTIFSNTLFLII